MPTPTDFSRVGFSNPGVDEPSQFSSEASGDPLDLAQQADHSRQAFLELQQFLNNNLETPGSRVCNYRDKPQAEKQQRALDSKENAQADFSGFQPSVANNLPTLHTHGSSPVFPETGEDQSPDEWSERPW